MNEIKDKIKQGVDILSINIQICQVIAINVDYDDNTNENNIKKLENNKDFNFKNIYILENFFGQVENIKITKWKSGKDKEEDALEYELSPYLLNDNSPYYDERFIEKINFINSNLAKVNYINYLEKKFDLVDYFLGVKPFMPFIFLIKEIYQNSKIKKICGIEINIFLQETFLNIIQVFLSILIIKKIRKRPPKPKKSNKNVTQTNEEKPEENKVYEDPIGLLKYDLFAFCIILQLPISLTFGREILDSDKIYSNMKNISDLFGKLFEGTPGTPDTQFLYLLINTLEEQFYSAIEGKDGFNEPILKNIIENNIKYLNPPLFFSYTYPQLFRHLMKELFIYNRLWSVKEVFFSKDSIDFYDEYFSKVKLKYKQISYYTKSLEQPYLYPVLEINQYIPRFSKFNKEELFNHNFKDTLSYEFKLNKNDMSKLINEYLSEQDIYTKLYGSQCCLVKKGYHVKGYLIIHETKREDRNREFYIIFQSYEIDDGEACNKKPSKKKEKNKDSNLCYGSVFHSPKKEMDRKIVIKLEHVDLIFIRNYFKTTSAIEIFDGKKNKSYYFNFHEILHEKHPFIVAFNDIKYFQKIKLNFKKYLGRFYNKNQKNILFSFLSDEFFPNPLDKKINYINRYDLLTLINLLSNRSFKDLYQYPVFPTLYKPSRILENESKKEIDLSRHLGLQDISDKNRKRMQLIKGLDDESDDCSYKGKSKENFIFNIHYSNPTFTGNYLIRVFPYSLTAIELQRDGFDSPNRQFYCIQKSLENTLSQKSDLREFIPELYYLPDLFFNKNQLKLGILSTGEEINNIYIKEKNEEDLVKYNYLKELKNYFMNDKELKLNNWIDLIFGINQDKCKDMGREYYSKDKIINLVKKQQLKEIGNNPLSLELFEFGVQPLKILDSKFPEHNINQNGIIGLVSSKLFEYYDSHLEVKNNKDICFLLEWDEYRNYTNYIKTFLSYSSETFDLKLPNYYKYLFKGNLLGDVTISKIVIDPNNSDYPEFECVEKSFSKDMDKKHYPKIYKSNKQKDAQINKHEKELIKLRDHYKPIKYIDYNPRLNLFLSYGLDGYINIYIFPNCKLIRTIKVKDITNSDDVLINIALVSNPYPMVFFQDINYIYILTINGDFINKQKIKKNSIVIPCLDKILGLSNDSICIFDENNYTIQEYDLHSFTNLSNNK